MITAALLLAVTITAPAHDFTTKSPEPPPTPLYITPSVSSIRVDGVLDEDGWNDAVVIELPFEFFPGDNVGAPVRTECRLTYDARNLYLGCTAHDPQPERIRANLTDRDRALQDDHITLLIDPFNDQRHSFLFRLNPRGVQMDALFVQGSEDFSWDAIWDSSGRITETGYVIEAAIPFRSLRFPRTDVQTWGVILERSYPRSVQHRLRSIRTDRNDTCLLCQAAEVRGFRGITPGRDVEISPTLTAARTDQRSSLPAGALDRGRPTADPGVSARWGITSALALNATVNPDFSQVEADVQQLNINERYAISYPEKRPFFLDGADAFQMLLPSVFTRKVVDPYFGVKVTGKEGAHTVGAFATHDRVNALILPSPQSSRLFMVDQEITGGVLRYKRDVGEASSIGGLVAGRIGDGYHNHVASADGVLRLSRTNTLRGQVLLTRTRYPDGVAAATQQPEGAFGGTSAVALFSHASRHWNGSAQFQHLSDGYRNDSGWLPLSGVRIMRGTTQRVVWGRPGGWYNRLAFTGQVERVETQRGRVLDQGGALTATYQGPRQTTASWVVSSFARHWNGENFDLVDHRGSFEMRPSGRVAVRLGSRVGDEIDYMNTRRALVFELAPAMDLRLGAHLNAEVRHSFQRLARPDGEQIFEANLTTARVAYNFSTRALVRATLQYQDVQRNPAAYVRPVTPEQQRILSQLLFSYKVNPQTMMFVGYSDSRLGELDYSPTTDSRSLFLKLGYALRL